jgi:hypothetical protein
MVFENESAFDEKSDSILILEESECIFCHAKNVIIETHNKYILYTCCGKKLDINMIKEVLKNIYGMDVNMVKQPENYQQDKELITKRAITIYFSLALAEEQSEINFDELQSALLEVNLPQFTSIDELEIVYESANWKAFVQDKLEKDKYYDRKISMNLDLDDI